MARGVNKVILIGNLGRDPETRYMPSGGAVTNVALATSESWKDKQTGQPVEKTEWHRLVFFNKLAEIAGEYLRKGSKIYVEGSLRTRKYQKDGVDQYATEIVVSEMQMLDGKGEERNHGTHQQQDYRGHTGSNQPNPTSQPNSMAPPANQPQGVHQRGQTQNTGPIGGFDNSFDEDIPF